MENKATNTISQSKMAMWRSLIALAYIDGNLSAEEKTMLFDYIKANHIDSVQLAQLEADINNGVKLEEVYPGITDVRDRANLLNAGRVLFFKDHDFSAGEQKVYDEIHRNQEEVVDFSKAKEHARKMAKEYEAKLTKEEEAERAKDGPIKRFINYIGELPGFFN